MIVYGITDPIQAPLRELLIWLHTAVGIPWAWAIVTTTIIVRTILLPLTVRQIHSMQNLQRHAPEMKAIQQKHKGDRQRMNEELMKFYKENNINPAASCLPILAQIPVFISLFFVLRDFDDNILPRVAAPGPLDWLGVVPDITERASAHWSGFLLLAIFAISQTTSTLLMSTTMERMQRTLLLILPLVFLFFILNFQAGLVLYWVTTNLWTTGQGLITRRLTQKKPEPPPKRSSRTPPREVTEEPAAGEAAPAAAQPQKPAVRKVKRKKKKARR